MREIRKTYMLSGAAVDDVSQEIAAWLRKHRIDNGNTERIRLTAEEMMLNILDHFGNDRDISTELIMRRKHGNLNVQINCSGDRYDPTLIYDGDSDISSMLKYLGIIPIWRYKNGINIISFNIPGNRIGSEFAVIGAVILAVLLGLLGGFIPENVSSIIVRYIIDPVSEIFLNLLSVFSGMLIFLSIVVGVCGIGGGSEFGKFGKYVIGRYLLSTFLFGGIAMIGIIPFFRFTWGESTSLSSAFDELFELVLSIVPDNLFKPFVENNMLQILLLAVIFGAVIVGAGDRSYRLRSSVSDLKLLFMNASELICKALPVFVFCSLLSLFWTNGLEMFVNLWQPIVACIAAASAFIIFQCLYVSIKFRMSPLLLFRKIMPSFIVGFTTASSMAAFGKSSDVNRKRLGISPRYSDFAQPMAIAIYDSVGILLFVPMTFYLVQQYSINVSVLWFIFTWFIITMATYATPQVSGGSLICIGIIFQQFGIPAEAIAIGSTIVLLSDFFITGAKVASSHFEMIMQAARLKMLDVDKLKSKKNLTL